MERFLSEASAGTWESRGSVCHDHYIIKFRKIILAIPVVAGAIYLAMMNVKQLPETVGINLLANGEYAYLVSRNLAIMGPLAVTALCLLLMMFSKKTLYVHNQIFAKDLPGYQHCA